MKKFCLLIIVMIGLVFSLSACSQTNKQEVDEQVEETNVLEDVQVDENQTIDEYVEEEVDDYNDETEARSKKYNSVLEGSSEDDF